MLAHGVWLPQTSRFKSNNHANIAYVLGTLLSQNGGEGNDSLPRSLLLLKRAHGRAARNGRPSQPLTSTPSTSRLRRWSPGVSAGTIRSRRGVEGEVIFKRGALSCCFARGGCQVSPLFPPREVATARGEDGLSRRERSDSPSSLSASCHRLTTGLDH